jgi:hypothetical protein
MTVCVLKPVRGNRLRRVWFLVLKPVLERALEIDGGEVLLWILKALLWLEVPGIRIARMMREKGKNPVAPTLASRGEWWFPFGWERGFPRSLPWCNF